MREILKLNWRTISRFRSQRFTPADLAGVPQHRQCLVAALHTRATAVRGMLPPGVPFMTLRLRSVGGSLEGQPRPSLNRRGLDCFDVGGFRTSSREVLIAVGLDPSLFAR